MNEPATPGQLRYLLFMRIATTPGLTKREAGRLIRDAKRRRAERQTAKEATHA